MIGFSVLIAGKAGFGIDRAGSLIGRILNQLGYRIYIYRDYPSIIRGGHTFSVIRAAQGRVFCHRNNVDFILALDQDTLDLHKSRIKDNTIIIYDSDSVKIEKLGSAVNNIGIALAKIIKEENASEIMRNTCIIGAFIKAAGIDFMALESALKKEIPKEFDINIKVARRGFDESEKKIETKSLSQQSLPLLSGSQAMGLGLIKGGLNNYIAYPMTPSSPLLHFLAEKQDDFNLKVIHPESEIAVILMSLGFAYMGQRAAIGTSGGGFCLMTEALSMAGMSELPIVIMLGMRPGPSTGLPTYSAQTELQFALNAGQGEFVRFLVAPGDAEEAYYWSAIAMNLSWKYQIPAIVLFDKDLGEGIYNFDINSIGNIKEEIPVLWNKELPYKRYADSDSGVSPLTFAPDKDAVIKVNSYEHDESGITTEAPDITVKMQDKRLRKEEYLAQELGNYKTVNTYGNKDSSVALLCWGSNKGVCIEAAGELGLKVIQPVVLSPFPEKEFREAVSGIRRLICVESNATGQFARLAKANGFNGYEKILKYDGRPFSLEELVARLKELSVGR